MVGRIPRIVNITRWIVVNIICITHHPCIISVIGFVIGSLIIVRNLTLLIGIDVIGMDGWKVTDVIGSAIARIGVGDCKNLRGVRTFLVIVRGRNA